MSQAYEGWQVRSRPAVIALALFVLVLFGFVAAAGAFYDLRFAPRTRPHPEAFPAPVLETVESAPSDAKDVPPPPLPVGIDRAMAETVAQGDALWNAS